LSLSEAKVQECRLDIINSYNNRKRIPKFVNSRRVAETDGTFSQIAIRTLTDDIWFTDPGHIPLYGRFGDAIADGEERFLIERVLAEIQDRELVALSDFNLELLTEIIASISPGDLLVLVPIKVKYDHMVKDPANWPIEYDYEMESFVLTNYPARLPLYSIHEDYIDSHIICLNKTFGEWLYQGFSNPYDPSGEETIFVEIERAEEPSKVEILTKSVVKFQVHDSDLVKVLQIT